MNTLITNIAQDAFRSAVISLHRLENEEQSCDLLKNVLSKCEWSVVMGEQEVDPELAKILQVIDELSDDSSAGGQDTRLCSNNFDRFDGDGPGDSAAGAR